MSRLRLERPHLIPLEESGLWFPGQDGAQRRIGGRMALAARLVDAPFPLWVASVHLESKTTAEDRQRQIRALLRGLDSFAAGEACVIGGDLNTKSLPEGEGEGEERGRRRWPSRTRGARAAVRRFPPGGLCLGRRQRGGRHATDRTFGRPPPPFRKLDWILVRGITPDAPRVIAALDPDGVAISDHEMLAVDLLPDAAP